MAYYITHTDSDLPHIKTKAKQLVIVLCSKTSRPRRGGGEFSFILKYISQFFKVNYQNEVS